MPNSPAQVRPSRKKSSPVSPPTGSLLSSLGQDNSLKWVESFLLRSQNWQEQHVDKWVRNYLAYQNFIELRQDWKSNIRFALELTMVETAKSAILEALLAPDPRLKFNPKGANSAEKAEAATRVMDHLMWRRANLETHLEDGVHNAMLYGPIVFKTGWRRTRRRVDDAVMLDIGGRTQRIPHGTREVIDEGPIIDTVPIWDYYPDVQGDDETTQQMIFHRLWITPQELLRRGAKGVYVKQGVKKLVDAHKAGQNLGYDTGPSGSNQERDARDIAGRADDFPDESVRTTERIAIYEGWSDEEVITVGDVGTENYVLLRHQRNHFPHGKKPFVVEHYIRQKRDPLGIGMVEHLTDVADTLSSFHNQSNDARRLMIDPRMLVRAGVYLDEEDMIGGPGDLIPVPNPATDMAPLKMDGRPEVGAEEEEALLRWGDRMSGTSDFRRGVATSGGSGTATEINAVSQASSTRTALVVRRINRALERLGGLCHSNAKRWMTQKAVVKMLGQTGFEWVGMGPEAVDGDFSVEPRGAFGDPTQQNSRDRWLVLGREFKDDPFVNHFEFRKRIFANLGEDDLHLLLKDPKGEASQPPDWENWAMEEGAEVPVSPHDDHEMHLRVHQAALQQLMQPDGSVREPSPQARTAIMRHVQEHMAAMAQGQAPNGQQPPQTPELTDGLGGGPGGQARALAAQTPGAQNGHLGIAAPGPGPDARGGGF